MNALPIVRIEDLYKSFGATTVLQGVNLSVQPREVVVIVGPSGTGKSTLLRCINLLTRPDRGRIWLEEQEITAPNTNEDRIRQRVGMVFQEFNLFHHLTALGNVTIGLRKVLKMDARAAQAKGMDELARVGLTDRAAYYPAQLSGGQKQRVAIARALAMDPHLMLFDEPTSALDPELTGEVLGVMRQLAAEGMTMLVVSHEMSFARQAANRIVFMESGAVHEEGPPERLFTRPRSPRTATFLGRIAVPSSSLAPPAQPGAADESWSI